jgi:hypothetical protein
MYTASGPSCPVLRPSLSLPTKVLFWPHDVFVNCLSQQRTIFLQQEQEQEQQQQQPVSLYAEDVVF